MGLSDANADKYAALLKYTESVKQGNISPAKSLFDGWNVVKLTHPTAAPHLFPFTPLELHAGYLIGKERIVTAISRSFADSSRPAGDWSLAQHRPTVSVWP